jgi:hypothetical protein
MMRRFQRLSMVRIFPRVADHTKKATQPQRDFNLPNTLPRKTETIMATHGIAQHVEYLTEMRIKL